ncbi:hypothetical protein [Flavilitoribacter nigricans]|uniref:Uncharacterized protein n=1 Tax=Flavilitoribacter nigricans (strain ATCC 23147 / DSM 23189 / NBRC 102662 / NCIMB 1420 / SS-2) TaxID=1122177 RepID=A0A2D0N0D6_FLAN2|nr:hypothetical protein [Flavilitoribacter nigricans]PHN01890.1 hypothetical protein CRP01_35225 [Flavilitoribacter nigricans DSM 23189 = NBRC 102662]
MKSFTPTFKADRDSNLPKLAAQDWEWREARAAQTEAAEARQKAILEALELAPRFDLHRLPQNFWVAILPFGEMSERQRGLPSGEMPKGQNGLSSGDIHKGKAILPAGRRPQDRGGVPLQQSIHIFSTEITGCTDLYHISNHVLFFRSNLPEQEIRENIDLSFLPF